MLNATAPIRTVAIAAALPTILLIAATPFSAAAELLPIPERLVVLTFDDGNRSDVEFVAPLLMQYEFGATFFVTDCNWFRHDKKTYMTYLKDHEYTVIAMRDLAKYVDPAKKPSDPMEPIQRRLGLQPVELKCEYLFDPLVIDTPRPRLSWVPQSLGRGQVQTAYRVLVATSEEKLQSNVGDKWDSGRVDSNQSIHVAYDGKPLASGEVCYWKVRLWGKQGRPSRWSEPATFAMGLLKKSDWQGTWIAMGDRDGPRFVPGRLRKAIGLDGHAQTVRFPHHARLKPKDQITISAWIRPTEIGNQWREVYRKDDGDARHLLAVGKDNGFHGLWCGLGIHGEYVERGAPLPPERLTDGRWHLVAATFDGSAIRLYADGMEIGAAEVKGKLDTGGTRPAFIGSLNGSSEFFAGAVDDVRIYDRALTAEQVATLAAGRADAAEEGLVAHWRFDGNTTDAVSDRSGTAAGAETSPAPRFRKEFHVDTEVRRARVYLSGLGYYELYINGRRVGNRVLDPVTSTYHNDQPYELSTRVYYTAYDVAEYLRLGGNVLGVQLGNGWYSAVSPAEGRKPYGDRPKLLLQMNVELADGRNSSVASDRTWKTAGGPVLDNDIVRGESYDARLETPGWTSVGFDGSSWQAVFLPEPPDGVLVAQSIPAAKVIETFEPVKILKPAEGVYVYDFGQNMSGWTKLRVRGPRGTKVQLRYSPRIHDGRLDTRPNRAGSQTDTYTLKGQGLEEWEPRFTLHGFRYVEVTGFPGELTTENLKAKFVHNDIDLAGEFACSNTLINQIHHNVLWTFLCSLQGIPQDAAEREERVAWLGDTGFVWEDYIYNIDMAAFTAKWLWDIRDTQRTTGELAVTAPKWRRSGQVGPRYAPYPCWISTYPLLTWFAYEYYGDVRVLRSHYDGVKKMIAYKSRHAPGHIFTHGLGDHMEPQTGGVSRFAPTQTSPRLTSTAYYYYDVWLLARIAEILGHDEDARHYFKLAGEIKVAFNQEFFDESAGYYGTGTQTASALALYFGMVPESRRESIVKHLDHDVTVNHKGHLSTGIIGTNALEQTMARHGQAELMFGIATQTTPPSWGYQVRQGATTVWETWEGEPHHSRNMKMLGSSEVFFFRDLAGIAPAGPGFQQTTIKPHIVGDLTWVKASHNTIRGPVAVHWRKGANSLAMDVTIPANTTAKVSVPTMGLEAVELTEGGKAIWKDSSYVGGVEGIGGGMRITNSVTFDVGSGKYSFRVKGSGRP